MRKRALKSLRVEPMPSLVGEAASKRMRGRPHVFSDDELRRAAQFAYARRVRTRRGAQDLVYRKFALVVIELYRESHPESAAAFDWLLHPAPRYSLLSELGRIGGPRSSIEGELQWNVRDVNRLIEAARDIAAVKPRTKDGIALIREFRRRYRDEEEHADAA
jgi:hypothetical protein